VAPRLTSSAMVILPPTADGALCRVCSVLDFRQALHCIRILSNQADQQRCLGVGAALGVQSQAIIRVALDSWSLAALVLRCGFFLQAFKRNALVMHAPRRICFCLQPSMMSGNAPAGAFSSMISFMNQYTAAIQKDGHFWIGWIEEVPGVNSQGNSREELLENLRSALFEALEMNREEALQAAGDHFEEVQISAISV